MTTVTFFATDLAGNTELPETVDVRVDMTSPTVTYEGNAGSYTVDQAVAITCAAVDPPNGSGSLCTLTRQFVEAPARSNELPPAVRARRDQALARLCEHLDNVRHALTPREKAWRQCQMSRLPFKV